MPARPEWWQVDLGSEQPVERLVLTLPPSAAWAARTQTIAVLGSTDGRTFTTLSAAAGRAFDPATGNSVTVSPASAAGTRYVRLQFTGNTGGPAGQLSGVSVFAS
jgi:hypothetical protein